MKVKILPVAAVAGSFLLYLSSCLKNNAVELGAVPCDTAHVSYSNQVVPILVNNCYSCHQGPGASSGVDFSSYGAFKGWAASTSFVIGDLTAAPGFTPMPYGMPRLSDCDINTILAWIHQGAPNN